MSVKSIILILQTVFIVEPRPLSRPQHLDIALDNILEHISNAETFSLSIQTLHLFCRATKYLED